MRGIRTRRLGQCGIVLAVCTVALTTYATGADAAPQTVHGSATVFGECEYEVDPVFLPDHDPLALEVKISSDASPQPHAAGSMTLSNTTVEIRVGADYFQGGVDAGTLGAGFTMPATVSVTLRGANTVEGTRTFTQNMTTTLQVVDGIATPLAMTLPLPDTVWHPESRESDVAFSAESERVVLDFEIEGIGRLILTADCTPSVSVPFIVLFGQPTIITAPTTTTTTFIGDPPIIGQETTVPAAAELPRTGSSSSDAVFFGLSCIAAGALLAGRGRKNRLP